MIFNLRSIFSACLAVLTVLPAMALAQKSFRGEQQIDVKIATVRSEELAYGLGVLALPICPQRLLSPSTPTPMMYVIPYSFLTRNWPSEALKKRYGAADKESVVLVEHELTPFAQAGFKVGDIAFDTSLKTMAPFAPRETYGERVVAFFAENPNQIYSVRRGDQVLKLTVANTLSCSGGLSVIDSTARYADSSQLRGIMVTHPLLTSLTLKEQAILIAHELGEQISGANLVNGSTGAALGVALLGNLGRIGSHGETGYRRPKPDDMAQADLVAMWLLSLIAVSPAEYLDLLIRLDAEKSALSTTDYATTRPLSLERIAFIKDAIARLDTEKSLPLPIVFKPESVEQLRAAADKSGLLPKIAAMLMPEPTVKP
jgi:hypothetical protein